MTQPVAGLKTIGASLWHLLSFEPNPGVIPFWIRFSCKALKVKDTFQEKLWLSSGTVDDIPKLLALIEGPAEAFNIRPFSAMNIARILYLYFKKLPIPLSTLELHERFLAAASLELFKDSTERLQYLRSVLGCLPSPNFFVFRKLLRVFAKIWNEQHRDTQRSTIEMWAPALFLRDNLHEYEQELPYFCHLLRVMIENHTELFPKRPKQQQSPLSTAKTIVQQFTAVTPTWLRVLNDANIQHIQLYYEKMEFMHKDMVEFLDKHHVQADELRHCIGLNFLKFRVLIDHLTLNPAGDIHQIIELHHLQRCHSHVVDLHNWFSKLLQDSAILPSFNTRTDSAQVEKFERYFNSRRLNGTIQRIYFSIDHEFGLFVNSVNSLLGGTLLRDPRHQSMIQKHTTDLISDPVAAQFWITRFGKNTFAVPWETFVKAFLSTTIAHLSNSPNIKRASVNLNDEKNNQNSLPSLSLFENSNQKEQLIERLCKIMDDAQIGFVSIVKFSQLLQGFGSMSVCALNCSHILSKPWFHGYLNRNEAIRLLEPLEPGTFVIRFATLDPSCFAVNFKDTNHQIYSIHINVIHKSINSTSPEKSTQNLNEQNSLLYSVKEEDTTVEFASLDDLVQHYSEFLIKPAVTKLFYQSYFFGDFTAQESASCLQHEPVGTFLVRFSSHHAKLALDYVNAEGRVIQQRLDRMPDSKIQLGTFIFQDLEHLVSETKELKKPYNHDNQVNTTQEEMDVRRKVVSFVYMIEDTEVLSIDSAIATLNARLFTVNKKLTKVLIDNLGVSSSTPPHSLKINNSSQNNNNQSPLVHFETLKRNSNDEEISSLISSSSSSNLPINTSSSSTSSIHTTGFTKRPHSRSNTNVSASPNLLALDKPYPSQLMALLAYQSFLNSTGAWPSTINHVGPFALPLKPSKKEEEELGNYLEKIASSEPLSPEDASKFCTLAFQLDPSLFKKIQKTAQSNWIKSFGGKKSVSLSTFSLVGKNFNLYELSQYRFTIDNKQKGTLQFYIETNSPQISSTGFFAMEPSEGVIESGKTIEIIVSAVLFKPCAIRDLIFVRMETLYESSSTGSNTGSNNSGSNISINLNSTSTSNNGSTGLIGTNLFGALKSVQSGHVAYSQTLVLTLNLLPNPIVPEQYQKEPYWRIHSGFLDFIKAGPLSNTVLGTGATATVYLTNLYGAKVAVKVWDLGAKSRPPTVFLQELSLLTKTRNSNLVQFIGAINEVGKCCLVMEYVTGGSLDKFIGMKNPTQEQVEIIIGARNQDPHSVSATPRTINNNEIHHDPQSPITPVGVGPLNLENGVIPLKRSPSLENTYGYQSSSSINLLQTPLTGGSSNEPTSPISKQNSGSSLALPLQKLELANSKNNVESVIQAITAVPPPSLANFMSRIPLALNIAKALLCLHEKNLIHRDVKSLNVLINKETLEVRLSDFGEAVFMDAALNDSVGSAPWMAPEVCLSKVYTTKADVFSFGLVLLELLILQYPIRSMHMIAEGLIPEIPSEYWIEYPAYVRLILVCTLQNPDKRPTMFSVVRELEKIVSSMQIRTARGMMKIH